MDLKLNSLAGAHPIKYSWPLLPSREGDIIETMRWVCEDLPEFKASLEKNILCDYDLHNFNSMQKLCERFNRTVDSVVNLAKGTSLPAQRYKKSPSRGLLRHILQQVYNEAVTDPEKLNQYKPFSPEVYGETSYDLINQMIDLIDIKSNDIFIDLGSGVGQVVLQMAAATACKMCLGIERADVPNAYAKIMDKQFRKWMQWYGKKFGIYKLIKGDFFAEEHREKINSATIVFVNNLAFGPSVDHQLKEIFANLRDGVHIVSSQSFCPLSFRINDRNLSDFATICNVKKMPRLPSAVSWTDRAVSYYIHTIDRTKLEKYFERLKNPNDFSQENISVNDASPSIKFDSSTDSGWSDTWSNKSEEVLKQQEKSAQPIRKAKTAKARGHRTPLALKILMKNFKNQYMKMLKQMKKVSFRNSIISQIKEAQAYNRILLYHVTQVENQISALKQEGVNSMKCCLRELDIEESVDDLLLKSKAIVQHNRTLHEKCKTLEFEVKRLETINDLIDVII